MTHIPSISDYGISARGYAEFFDGIPAAIFRTTLEGKIVYCNKAYADIFGFGSADELIDAPVIDLYRNKKDRGVFIHSLLQRGRLSDLPIAFKMKDGTPIMCAVSAKAVLDDDEMVVHLDGYVREITGRIEVEEDIVRMDGSADDLKDAVIVIDLHGGLIDINQAGVDLMGFSREEMLGQSVSTFFAPEDRDFFLIFLADIIKLGRNETILVVTDRSAQKKHIDWHAYLVRNDNQPHHIKCIARDVSDIVKRQQDRNTDEKFQGVLEMAGGVAHSLNQPLTIVNNLLNEILSELDSDGIVFPKVQKVYDQMKKLNEIAQKIGNIKKYEAMDYVAGVKIVDIDKSSWAQTVKDIS
jgi:PAS domain S-box-containing protein